MKAIIYTVCAIVFLGFTVYFFKADTSAIEALANNIGRLIMLAIFILVVILVSPHDSPRG